MTLRKQLQAKASRFFGASAAFFFVLGVTIWLAGPHVTPAVLVLLFALFVLPVILLNAYFRCPRCMVGLGALVAHFGPLNSMGKSVDFCPFCGAHLDDQLRP
jgi:hypothetical protein